MQSCVDQVFSAADLALGHKSRYKPEISWNMNEKPPTPFMHREHGQDTTRPSEYWQGRAKSDIEQYHPGQGWVRRPDLTIVDDPSRPPGPGNTERVVEIKFRDDRRDEEQDDAYVKIAGGRGNYSVFRIDGKAAKDEESCACDARRKRQPVPETVPVPEESKALAKFLTAFGWSTLAVLGAVGTGIAILSPFDGPVGDVAAASATSTAAFRAAQAWRAFAAAF